jgi:hypothetical protein
VPRAGNKDAPPSVLQAPKLSARLMEYSFVDRDFQKAPVLSDIQGKWIYALFRPQGAAEAVLLDEIFAAGPKSWVSAKQPGEKADAGSFPPYPYLTGYYRLAREGGQHMFLVSPGQLDRRGALEQCRAFPGNASVCIRSLAPAPKKDAPYAFDFTNLAFLAGGEQIFFEGPAAPVAESAAEAAAEAAGESALEGGAEAVGVGAGGVALGPVIVGLIVIVIILTAFDGPSENGEDALLRKRAEEALERQERLREAYRAYLQSLWLNGFIDDFAFFNHMAAGTLPGLIYYPFECEPSTNPESDKDLSLSFKEGPLNFTVRGYADYDVHALPAKVLPPPVLPPSNAAAYDAREEFKKVRDQYAARLGVKKWGQVHHAIELQVLTMFPGAFSRAELNGFANMRGIPIEDCGRQQLHNSKIREFWNRHYALLTDTLLQQGLTPVMLRYRILVREFLIDARDEIDYLLGQFFSEYRSGLPRFFK